MDCNRLQSDVTSCIQRVRSGKAGIFRPKRGMGNRNPLSFYYIRMRPQVGSEPLDAFFPAANPSSPPLRLRTRFRPAQGRGIGLALLFGGQPPLGKAMIRGPPTVGSGGDRSSGPGEVRTPLGHPAPDG